VGPSTETGWLTPVCDSAKDWREIENSAGQYPQASEFDKIDVWNRRKNLTSETCIRRIDPMKTNKIASSLKPDNKGSRQRHGYHGVAGSLGTLHRSEIQKHAP